MAKWSTGQLPEHLDILVCEPEVDGTTWRMRWVGRRRPRCARHAWEHGLHSEGRFKRLRESARPEVDLSHRPDHLPHRPRSCLNA